MEDTQLYSQILGVQAPWEVVQVALDPNQGTVCVYLNFDGAKATFYCPTCGKQANLYDRREVRMWRHLDTCQFQTFLVASLPRVSCREHGVHTVAVFWAEPHARFTALFECFAISLLLATQVQRKAANLLKLSAEQISYLMQKAVARGLLQRDNNQRVVHAGIDEKSIQEGHHYATILTDLDNQRVLEMVEHRTEEAATSLLKTGLSEVQKASVESVSMDMWLAFANAKETILPHADKVHDRFHISGYLNDAVDATRKAENRKLFAQEDKTLSKTKYLWLRSEGNLSAKQAQQLEALTGLELETAKVWAFKECFRQFFDCQSEYGAKVFFFQWYDAACALGNAPLTKVAQMLHNHLEGLLAYMRHRVTNAIAENLNGQIQRVKSNARGFRNFANFRVAVLFFLGKLDLYPHTLR